MNNSRRDFLKKTAYVAAGASALPFVSYACSSTKKSSTMEIGVQIYSVRNELQADFEGTLQKIAAIGYDYIEAYGLGTDGLYFGRMKPADFRRMVEGMGMRIASTHSSYFTESAAEIMINAAKLSGADQLIIPYIAEDQRFNYQRHAENLNAIGQIFKAGGVRFGYHNHDFEFQPLEDGQIPMEILLNLTEADLVDFQLDLYWITKAGYDALEFIEKYPGRFSSYHIKDATSDLNQTTVGSGIINFQEILAKNSEIGIDLFFVEDEREDDPLANIAAAHEYLLNLTN
jgi:sugar phosphate isomerase/epimerase